MAHPVEPMDIDGDFDNKENSFHHSNVLPCTEKGYEELDVSELNMKLRYSVTPASSPMSKSYTANCVDNRSFESGDDSLNVTVNENANLTRSLNTNLKNDNVIKSLKSLPLKSISKEFVDNNRSTSVLRPLDTTITPDNANVTVTVSGPSDIDENLSLPSSSSSAAHTPEATTPTKENSKNDEGSPIMRGLKSVLNMFRSSQSPIPPAESEETVKDLSSSEHVAKSENTKAVMASTPISAHRKKETSPSKRNSPYKESIVFNEDLEKELQWKDETTILFSQERIPIHKLFLQQNQPETKNVDKLVKEVAPDGDLNSTLEYMDISYNDSILKDKTMTETLNVNKVDNPVASESDSEFVDCETTFTKNETLVIDDQENVDQSQNNNATKNESTSKLKPIILNTTQDILNATLSITPEDLNTDVLDITKELPVNVLVTDTNHVKNVDKFNEATIIDNCEQQIVINTETSQSEIKSEASDVAKNVENITMDQKIMEDQIIRNNENLDMTQSIPIEHVVNDSSQPLEKLDITNTIGDQTYIAGKLDASDQHSVDMNSTHPVEYEKNIAKIIAATEQVNNVLVEHNEVQEESNVQVTESGDAPDQVADISDNINTANDIRVTHKTVAHHNHPVLENNNLITEHEFSIEQVNVPKVDIDMVNNTFEVPLENTERNVNDIIPETFIAISENLPQLPADIPLPDEDDIDKELNVTVEMHQAVALGPNSLTVDLVEDNKMKAETTDVIGEPTLEGNDKIPPPETLEISDTKTEENKEQNKPVEVSSPELKRELEDTHNIILTDNLILKNQPENSNNKILPEIVEVPVYLVKSDDKFPSQEADNSRVLSETLTITETIKNYTLPNQVQEFKPELHTPLAMDINDSVCEYKPLPDIINQISTSCHDTVEVVKATELLEKQQSQVESTVEDNIENIVFEVPNVIGIMIDPVEYNAEESGVPIISQILEENALTSKNVTEETPVSLNSNATVIDHDAVANMSIDEPEKVIEIEKDDTQQDSAKTTVSSNEAPADKSLLGEVHGVPDLDEIAEPDAKVVDEEILTSENGSPFVSVITKSKTENIEDPFATKARIVFTPPSSPPIASKGYNFNFDEIDDPFSTKTIIRTSPTTDTPSKIAEPKESDLNVKKPMPKKEINNRRKSQPERKRPPPPKKKLNSTFCGASEILTVNKPIHKIETDEFEEMRSEDTNTLFDNEDKEVQDIIKAANKNIEQKLKEVLNSNNERNSVDDKSIVQKPVEQKQIEEKCSVDSVIDNKTSSSSEQSTYFSAGTSSSESIKSKNVFNLPEIDDMNFNPFATKSKMRQSPPLNKDTDNPFATRSQVMCSPDIQVNDTNVTTYFTEAKSTDDKMEMEPMEKDSSNNISNTTTSSKATDEKDVTMREMNTEDDDTEEGPFLEVEDLHDDFKTTGIDTKNDMIQFKDKSPQRKEENPEADELFIDAEAFEFLLNQNKTNTVVDSGKESLFLKFDPLFAKRMSSEGVLAALTQLQKRQSTPTKLMKLPEKEVTSPIAGPSNMNITHDLDMNTSDDLNDDLNVTVSKPMMVVPPAVNPVTPRNKSITPTRSNRRSVTFTSPAMAVIDRLLSLSANNSPMNDNNYTHISREQNEADLALTQLRELLAEKEIHVYNLRTESKDLKDRLSTMETQVRSLETESQTRLKKISDLNDRLAEKTKINKSMAAVVEEYERTIASLIAETEQDKKRHAEERMKLISERDEQTAHLASMEVSFSDLHSKYEKSKQVILACKANEDTYKKSIKEFEANLSKMQNNYELLKQHATSKLNHANQELEKMNKAHEADFLKLNAMIKRKELHITSLEETLAQKTKANEELTAICDELINKVG